MNCKRIDPKIKLTFAHLSASRYFSDTEKLLKNAKNVKKKGCMRDKKGK